VDISGLNLGASAANPENTRILAHAGVTRSRFAPDVPTFKELGMDIEMASERGIVAPAATPAPILARLREATAAVAQDPQFRQQLEQRYSELAYEPHEAWFARLGQREAEYRRLWQTTPWNR
jgi:tripartite-type tricarboxylate transporter receptor subunit TctC